MVVGKQGGIARPGLTTPDLDDSCFIFLWPRRLGRSPKSIVLEKFFLLSPAKGRGWDWASSRVSSSTKPFPLFSFMVAIPVKKNVRAWLKQIIIIIKFLSKNLRLRVVSSWAKASRDGLGPSPQVARRSRVTKERKLLSVNRRALWTRSRWNLLKEGLLTTKKKGLDEYKKGRKILSRKETYLLDKGSLFLQYRGRMNPCLPQQGSQPKNQRRKRTSSSNFYQT